MQTGWKLQFPTPGREIKTILFEDCLNKGLEKGHSALPLKKSAGEIILICSLTQLTDNLVRRRKHIERQCHSVFPPFIKHLFIEHLLFAKG